VTLDEGWAETTATALEPGGVEIRAAWDTGDGVATAGWTVNVTPH